MFSTLKEMYEGNRLEKPLLKRAVAPKQWITEEQYAEIAKEDYKTGFPIEKAE